MPNKLIYIISFIFVLSVALTGTAKAELVGWWKFDEGSGTTATDSSENGYDGTVGGESTWADGKHGSALAFVFFVSSWLKINTCRRHVQETLNVRKVRCGLWPHLVYKPRRARSSRRGCRQV